MRSDVHKFGDRCRERATIKSWCLRIRDSATMERTPLAPSKRARVARKWTKRGTRLLIAESYQEGKSQGNMGKTTIRQPQDSNDTKYISLKELLDFVVVDLNNPGISQLSYAVS